MKEGIIIKGIGGFYYVRTKEKTYETRARGLFREENITPLVGDRVVIRINSEDDSGYIEEIKPRKTELLRPPVANIDQVVIVMSIKAPDINLWLLDKFLVMSEYEKLDIIIVLSKTDLVEKKQLEYIKDIYNKAKYKVIELSNYNEIGIEEIKNILENKITAFAGPSGVGKSTLLNSIDKNLNLETGDISQKTERGKHTTRHVELMELNNGSFVLDTPGFSSLNLDFIEEQVELSYYFREFLDENRPCKFRGCLHDKEPGCSVKERVDEGIIAEERYENYIRILEDIKNNRRY